tara:strand:+ start:2158 stop:2370 length:213 start_codon:yes stop_codon:yes gene_type:complete
MEDHEKFWIAVRVLKSDVECTVNGSIEAEDDYNNNILWNTGIDGENATSSKICPHAEITWAAVKAEMDKL